MQSSTVFHSSARWKSVTDATPYSLSKPKISSVANPDPGSGFRDPVPFWPLDLGFGIQDRDPGKVKSQDSDPGWKTRIIFLRAEKPFFWVKILKFFDADQGSNIRDGKKSDPGSGIQDGNNLDPGSRIRDGKNSDPGSKIQDKQQNWKSCRQIC